MQQTTLAIMVKSWKIFLWEKKRGFAKWVLNWVWGKQEWNESIDECMIREAKEEIWIEIKKMQKVGILHFYFEGKKEYNQDVHLFFVEKWDGKIIETEEIRPFWFDLKNIPYEKMWKDDIIWLPRILDWEKNIEYNFFFNFENWNLEKWEKLI